MGYVYPQEEAVRKLFVGLGGLERAEPGMGAVGVLQNRGHWQKPSSPNDPKILNTINCAEVVELADTPSARIALAILYKLLIIKPFTSITSIDSPQSGQ